MPRSLAYLALTAVAGWLLIAVVEPARFNGLVRSLIAAAALVAVVTWVARPVAAFELRRLRWARTPPIAAPTRRRRERGRGLLAALGDGVADAHNWLAALYLVLAPLLAAATSTLWAGWLVVTVALVGLPAWGQFVPVSTTGRPMLAPNLSGDRLRVDGRPLTEIVSWLFVGRADTAGVVWFVAGCTAIGLLLLALLPFVTRGAVLAHWGLARLLLARFRSDDLRETVARVGAAQRAAVAAEDRALRRLERDIHDGAQQRLLRLQMELAAAERRLDDDPVVAREAIEVGRRLAAETLDELRALAQGFAPPLLQDRGLAAALEALGRRGPLPIETRVAFDGQFPGAVLSDAVQRSVYFVAAELTSNAIKYADARRIVLEAVIESGAEPSSGSSAEGRRLRLEVSDDGRGGAQVTTGHGLAGAIERLAGLGGTLTVVSPTGGPTRITAIVPLP
ncbi:sensor histidine kinase [uncultured Amnibacterium sp.]|uniref:sensor histidine kinase n=1 Tax=uncultured Amnibacterium sp. TaxID=1631851 RepID=UPI0035CAAE33